jgi:hypothetical protein
VLHSDLSYLAVCSFVYSLCYSSFPHFVRILVVLHFLFHLYVCYWLVPIVNFLVYFLAGLVYGFLLELGLFVWTCVVYDPVLVFSLLVV